MSDREKTAMVLAALQQHHARARGNGLSAAWVYAEEVRVSTGFSGGVHLPRELLGTSEQRIDAFAIHTWPSKGWVRRAYEVKVSRSDLRKELSDHDKSAAARFLSNQFVLVVHDSVPVTKGEVPPSWGLWRCSDDGDLRTVRPGLVKHREPPPLPFMVSFARAVAATTARYAEVLT